MKSPTPSLISQAAGELLPCPFCGGKAIITGKQVGCGNEWCSVDAAFVKADTLARSIECWNTRPGSKVLQWKLVPVEPTNAMIDAACPAGETVDHFDMGTALREAIKAAPISTAPTTGSAPVAIYQVATTFGDWRDVNQHTFEEDKYAGAKVRIVFAADLANADRLASLEIAMEGVSQEMLDGGWNARSLSKYAKSLEDKIAANAQAPSAPLLDAAKAFYNATIADTSVIVRAPSADKRDNIKRLGDELRVTLLAASMGGDKA